MALTTSLNKPPYYDDFDNTKGYYKPLFKTGVSVQSRELNQLHTMLQNQIEKFGDHVFSKGTIIQGCNFTFYNPLFYIKIKDISIDGDSVNVSSLLNYSIINETTGLRASIINTFDGYETTSPDLKTLYVKYTSTGYNANLTEFSSGDILKVYDPVYNGISKVSILGSGSGFSNTDPVLAISDISVLVTSGTFSNGEYITNGLGANLQITNIDSTTLANTSEIILSLSPRTTDLANASSNAVSWTISNNTTITNSGNTAQGLVTSIYGSGFQGKIVTNYVGGVVDLLVLDQGVGYVYPPTITVRSINNSSGYSSLNLLPQNYIAKITVAGSSNSVGNGYAFGVSEGTIYQKGYLVDVIPQIIIVEKYNTSPNNVSVGFDTIEEIINSNIDQSLNDPASTGNNDAPGADRLKLTPKLVLANTDTTASNAEFFTICSWNNGNPYRQTQETIYSVIGDKMAKTTKEQSGNFVINPFLITSRSPINANNEGAYVDFVIDPGIAYIDGYRVETKTNYTTSVLKPTTTQTKNNYTVSLNYGSYLTVNNVTGVFKYNIGDTVYFYDNTKSYIANTDLVKSQNISPVGNLIGTASIRSLVKEDGVAGTPQSTFNMYLFNIKMSNGHSFSQVKSVYANNSSLYGIADAVQTPTSNGSNVTVLNDPTNSFMLFPTRLESLKNANNIIYTYRTIDTSLTVSNTGLITKDISSTGNEFFPYSANLTSNQLEDLYLVPTYADLLFAANSTGTVSGNTTSNVVVGTSTLFTTEHAVGDYVYFWTNSTFYDVRQIRGITNATYMTIDSPTTSQNTSTHITRVFPKNVPLPLGDRSGISANVNSNTNILNINLGNTFTATAQSIALGCNIQRVNVSQVTKSANRKGFVKIYASNNVANTIGPWCLGVPDIFRLRSVYIGNSSVSNTSTNYVSNFYVDHNQTPDFLDLGYLYKKSSSSLTIDANTYLLCEFDYFTSSGVGVVDTVSYIGSNTTTVQTNDSLPLSDLTTNINIYEVPELFTSTGEEIDLLQAFDFRPYNTNTVSASATYGSAPINPPEVYNFGSTEKKFPLPDSLMYTNVEYYLGRTDSVVIDQNGQFSILNGTPEVDPSKRIAPTSSASTMKLTDVSIPPYPNIPVNPSLNINQIINTNVLNQHKTTNRIARTLVRPLAINLVRPYNQPQRYTMSDVGELDRRLKAVEYYVSLSQLEANIANMAIPSSTDPTVNRFKFGYFADDFSTTSFSDLNDPQYSVTKENGDIVPQKILFDVNLLNATGSLPYIEETIVSQENATSGSLLDPEFQPTCGIAYANTVAYSTEFRNWTDGIAGYNLNSNTYVDTVTFDFADLAHIAEYYQAATGTNLSQGGNFAGSGGLNQVYTNAARMNELINRANTTTNRLVVTAVEAVQASRSPKTTLTGIGDLWTFYPSAEAPPVALYFQMYDSPTKIEIYQGNTLILDTSSANAMTTSEKTYLTSPSGANWFSDQSTLYLKDSVDTGNGYVTFAGKLTFNYDYSGSNKFTIKTTTNNVNRSWNPWRWALSFPINGSSVGCTPPTAEWVRISYHCTNGVGVFGGFVPRLNEAYALNTSTSQFNIENIWGGQAAPGEQVEVTQQNIAYTNVKIIFSH